MRKKIIIAGVLGLGLAGLVGTAGSANSATPPKPRPVTCDGLSVEAVPGKPGVTTLRAVPSLPGKGWAKAEIAVTLSARPGKAGEKAIVLRAVPGKPQGKAGKVEVATAVPALPGKVGEGSVKVLGEALTGPVCTTLPAEKATR